jgi:hypothetical protein
MRTARLPAPYAPFGSYSGLLTEATRRLGSKVMDDDLELEGSVVPREERVERFSDALRSVYDDLDGDVLSLDD